MSARTNQVTDEYSRPVPGASIYVYNQDGTDAALTSDGTTPLAQPVISDEFGTYTYWAADGIYREDIWFAGKLRYQSVIVIGDVSALKGDPGSPGEGYATRTAMAARAAPAVLDDVYLTEAGREGKFVVDLASNWTAAIAADTAQGLFVPSTADATKVYRRVFDGSLLPQWFGAKLDNVTNDGAAITAAVAMSSALKNAPNGFGAGAGPSLRVPGIAYMGSTTLTLSHIFLLWGESEGNAACWPDGFRWDDGVTGIENPGRATIRGLAFFGGFTGTEGEHHAIHATETFTYRDLAFLNWSGDAMSLDCSSGGNVNGVVGENVWCQNCRSGLSNKGGGDNNAGSHKNWNIESCREIGIKDLCFLTSNHYNHEVANCGITSFNDGVNIPAACVSSGGNRYFVIAGQEAGASTNAPSGTTADNTWWAFMGAGGVAAGFPAWFSGILCRNGGAYYTIGINGTILLSGCYFEVGQPFAQLSGDTLAEGGNLFIWKGSIASTQVPNFSLLGLTNRQSYVSQSYKGTDETVTAALGESNASVKTLVTITGSVSFPSTFRWEIDGGDLVARYAEFFEYYRLTGPTTARTFGRSAPVPTVFSAPTNFAFGNGAFARIFDIEPAAPTTGSHAQGEFVFNVTPAASGASSNAGWKCRTAGTPGTWDKFGGTAATSSATFVAPTGGTTVDTQGRASLTQLAADLADMKSKMQAAGLMA